MIEPKIETTTAHSHVTYTHRNKNEMSRLCSTRQLTVYAAEAEKSKIEFQRTIMSFCLGRMAVRPISMFQSINWKTILFSCDESTTTHQPLFAIKAIALGYRAKSVNNNF